MSTIIVNDQITDMLHILKCDLIAFKKSGNSKDEATLGKDFALVMPLANELHNNTKKVLVKANKEWIKAEYQPHMFKKSTDFIEHMDNAINDISV